jgi:hypothetical protein
MELGLPMRCGRGARVSSIDQILPRSAIRSPVASRDLQVSLHRKLGENNQ